MAVFPGVPNGPQLNAAIQAVRNKLNANTYIAQEVDRQVGVAAPQNTAAWETARGQAIKQALLANTSFRDAVKNDPIAGPIMDPTI